MTFNLPAAVADLRLPTPKMAVVVGGTTGIGAAVARTFSGIGIARLVDVGRDEARARDVLAACRARAAVEGAGDIEVEFVRADLSWNREGSLRCARELERVAGGRIDYLIMCQNGVPRARLAMNVDGDDTPFAVQALSRFLISHTLVTRGALTPGAVVVSVANVGQSNDTLSVDDLSLKAQLPACRTRLGAFFAQSFRDSSVLDAFITEQNARYPQYRFFHVFPELVASELFEYAAFPFPMNWAIWLLMATPMARTPEAIAQVVVYTAVEPDTVEQLGGRFIGPKFNRIPLGKWASDAGNRKALWDKLVAMAE